jgi:hypothetical protein
MSEPQDPPLLTPSASGALGSAERTRPLSIAFLAATVVAVLGGLLWAGIVIGTGYGLGIVALVIGAATGLTAQFVHGRPIGGFERALAGLFAAGAVTVGYYVIFVHEIRVTPDVINGGTSPGYFDGHAMNVFINHIGSIIPGRDWLWIALAAFAAVRTTGRVGRIRA